MSKKKPAVCEWCGDELDEEERKFPREKGMCDDCFHEKREFRCCRCGNHELKGYQHRFLVVFVDGYGENSDIPLKRGIYEIVDFPYFGGSMLGGGHFFDRCLRQLKPAVDWASSDGYPSGHLCRDCVRKLRLRQSNVGKKITCGARLIEHQTLWRPPK